MSIDLIQAPGVAGTIENKLLAYDPSLKRVAESLSERLRAGEGEELGWYEAPHRLCPSWGERVWVRLEASSSCLRIQRIGREILGAGSFKTVLASQTLCVPLGDGPIHWEDTVAFRIASAYNVQETQRGVKAVKEALGDPQKIPELRLAGCWAGFDVQKDPYTSELFAHWAEGPRLHSPMENGGIREVLNRFADYGRTLEILHASQILHGDISKGNLMSDAEGRGWLIDLDWCGPIRAWHRDERARRDILWAKEGLLSPISDIYALAYQLAQAVFGETFKRAVEDFGGHTRQGMGDSAFLEKALPLGWGEVEDQVALGVRGVFADCQRFHAEVDQALLDELRGDKWAAVFKWQKMEEALENYPGLRGYLGELASWRSLSTG